MYLSAAADLNCADIPHRRLTVLPPDLNCADIPHRRFTVLPPDPHRFDGDGDGIGCERGYTVVSAAG